MHQTQSSDSFQNHKKYSNPPHKNQEAQLNSQSDSQPQTTNQPSKNQQYQEPSIQFKDSPIQMKCPFCLQNIRSQIILKPQFISILLGFTLFTLLPNFPMLIIIIVILQITATRKHRCPLCQRQLGSDGKFLIFFKDQVYSFVLGTNGIIVSKKILATIGLGVTIFAILSMRLNNAYADAVFTDMSWKQFYGSCPYQSRQQKCMYGHEGLTVKNWKGYVMRVQDNRNSVRRHFMYAVSLYIKMNDPITMYEYKQRPDLFLTITSFQAHDWQQKLDRLSHGDEIQFNATFQYLRNSRNIPTGRHLNIIDFNYTGTHNPDIHVYMSEEEDSWFFENLSGQKLRKHQNNDEQIQNEVEMEILKQIEGNIIVNPTQKQKQVLNDNHPENKV